MKSPLRAPMAFSALSLLAACAGSMNMKKPEQGISGTFTTYGPPPVLIDCGSMITQSDKDSCRHGNARVVEEPYRSVIRIRNLDTGENLNQPLDAQGSYRVPLVPGQYEVCVNGECSDPLEVTMGAFATYGRRFPRAGSDAAKAPGDTTQAGIRRIP